MRAAAGLLLIPLFAPALPAQTPAAPTPTTPPATAPQPSRVVQLAYPRDQNFAVASVDDKALTLEDLAKHIEERHTPDFRAFLASESGQLLLRSDLLAPWVREFADIHALMAEAAERKLAAEATEKCLQAALKEGFESYLQEYAAREKQAGRSGEFSKARLGNLEHDYQMRQGLGCELQGWLNCLVPGDYTEKELRDFFNDNARLFGGAVTFAHILVMHRDTGTGLLLNDEERGKALARLAEVKASLRPDGSNFAEIARLKSEDVRTAQRGGEMREVGRFDDRLPAILCRTAWSLKDGEMSGVIESQYGFHILKRLSMGQHKFMILTNDSMPTVRGMMRRSKQEDLMFSLRDRHQVTLHL